MFKPKEDRLNYGQLLLPVFIPFVFIVTIPLPIRNCLIKRIADREYLG